MSQPIQETLVLCNLDHLTSGPEYSLLPSDISVLELFCRKGGRLSFFTRHAPWELGGLLEKVPLTTPVICCDGAMIFDPVKSMVIQATGLNEQEAMKAIRDLIFRFPGISAEVICKDNRIYVARNNRLTAKQMERYNLPFQLLPLEEIPHGWVNVTIRSEQEQMEAITQHMRRKYYGVGNYIHPIDENSLAIMSTNTRREIALTQLRQILEVPQENCVLLAEREEDSSLLPMVGRLVCGPKATGTVGEFSDERTMCGLTNGGLGEYLYELIRKAD